MKLKILVIVATLLLAVLSSQVALAADPTEVTVVVISPEPVDANLQLTGSTISVSVNGSGLATSDQVAQISSNFQGILYSLAEIYNLQNSLSPQIEMHSQAIVKLITDFTFDKENLSVLKSELKILNNKLSDYSTKGINVDRELASGIDLIITRLDKLENDLSTLDDFKSEITDVMDSIDSKVSDLNKSQLAAEAVFGNQINNLQAQIDSLKSTQLENQKNAEKADVIAIILIVALLLTQAIFAIVIVKKMK